jgi:hypothetical protein
VKVTVESGEWHCKEMNLMKTNCNPTNHRTYTTSFHYYRLFDLHETCDSTFEVCECRDAQTKIDSGQIDCSQDICPDNCSTCTVCLESVISCIPSTRIQLGYELPPFDLIQELASIEETVETDFFNLDHCDTYLVLRKIAVQGIVNAMMRIVVLKAVKLKPLHFVQMIVRCASSVLILFWVFMTDSIIELHAFGARPACNILEILQ